MTDDILATVKAATDSDEGWNWNSAIAGVWVWKSSRIRDWLRALVAEVERLRVGQHLCAYCGLTIEGNSWDALWAHIDVCEKHPLAALRERHAADLVLLQRGMELVNRAIDVPDIHGYAKDSEGRCLACAWLAEARKRVAT